MGYVKHNVIVVVGFDNDVGVAWQKAKDLFEEKLTDIVEGKGNGYCSFMIVPDGSKEGWETSNEWDEKREEYWKWLNAYETKESEWGKKGTKIIKYLSVVGIRFGGDDEDIEVGEDI